MDISSNKLKFFKIKNRKGYAAVCLNHLTEGKTTTQAYDRMLKALKKNGIHFKKEPQNLKGKIVSL